LQALRGGRGCLGSPQMSLRAKTSSSLQRCKHSWVQVLAANPGDLAN
jgi:hypothetical protein